MKTILSRLSMKCQHYLFWDAVEKKGVYLFLDKYGQEWMANYPFRFWSYRTKYYRATDNCNY